MNDTTHISSLVVTAHPDRIDTVLEKIDAMPPVEIAATDPSGKIVVTLITPSEAEIVEYLNQLNLIDGVATASLVYHQTDSDEQTQSEGRVS